MSERLALELTFQKISSRWPKGSLEAKDKVMLKEEGLELGAAWTAIPFMTLPL